MSIEIQWQKCGLFVQWNTKQWQSMSHRYIDTHGWASKTLSVPGKKQVKRMCTLRSYYTGSKDR